GVDLQVKRAVGLLQRTIRMMHVVDNQLNQSGVVVLQGVTKRRRNAVLKVLLYRFQLTGNGGLDLAHSCTSRRRPRRVPARACQWGQPTMYDVTRSGAIRSAARRGTGRDWSDNPLETLEDAWDLQSRELRDPSRELKFGVQSRVPKDLHRELLEHPPASLPSTQTG
ncbi:hypothetical protein BC826DRAFT_976826, partial [Russula brevipes]